MFRITRSSLASTDSRRHLARVVAAGLALFGLIATGVAQAPAGGNKLTSVDVKPLSGHQMEVRLRLDGPASEPLSFTIDRPARIALDLANTSLALEQRRIDVKSGGVDSIVAVESKDRTRLVLNMDAVMPYQTRVEGNEIVLTVGGPAPGGDGVQQTAAASTKAVASAPAASNGFSLRDVSFHRSTDGSGHVVVDLSDSHTPVSMTQQGTQILLDFKGVTLPTELMKSYDAADFNTPVSSFDVMRTNDGARIVIHGTGNFDPIAYQANTRYTVEVKPVVRTAAASTSMDKKQYKGERLTLNFQDIETRAVLPILADTGGQNIVVSDAVGGNVTLKLQNVPWDQALDIVLKTKGLDKRQEDNVIIVAPISELAEHERAELAALKDKQELAPLRTESIQVNYAKATDLATLLRSSGGERSLLSGRGSVSVDDRTNKLLVLETNDRLGEIRKLVESLDIPVRQVLIEARVVIANEDFTRSLGVRAGFTGVQTNGSSGLSTITGNAAGADSILDSGLGNINTTGSPFPVSVPTADSASNRYMVNLPATNPAGRFALAVLGSDYIVDLELSAAQAEGNGKVVSSPKMITANQKEATIEQGTEIPYQESSSSGATTISFKKAVLSLKATPQITPDNRVILDISVSKDSVGINVPTGSGGSVPSIDTRKINTGGVLVNDGQTIVLGGILETEERDSENKVPLLGDIPILGHLFKSTIKTNNKRELLIFITPKILHEGSAVR